MTKRYLAGFLLAFVACVAWAGGFSETYEPLNAAPSEQLTNSSAGDSLTVGSTPLAGRAVAVNGNPTCYAKADFSGSSGDTALIYCLVWHQKGSTWTFLGYTSATVTAGAVVDAASDNVAPLAAFDTGAGTHVEVRTAQPSAGTVDLTYWCGSADGGR